MNPRLINLMILLDFIIKWSLIENIMNLSNYIVLYNVCLCQERLISDLISIIIIIIGR